MRQTVLPKYDSQAIKLQSVFEFKELLRYRFLIRNLISRDLKVRYKRSVLGFFWVMLNPLLTMGVLTIVFSYFARFNTQYYATYLLSGILVWNLYAQGTTAAMTNLYTNGSILRKIYVPPSVFVASSIGSALLNFVFAIAPFFILAIVNGVPLSIYWFFIIIPSVETAIFAFGVGLIISALMVYFSDTYEIYNVLVNLYLYLTPVYYPISILPAKLQTLEHYNPMYLLMNSFRMAVLNGTLPSTTDTFLAGVFSLGVFLVGWFIFTRLEKNFAYHF